MRDVAKKVAWAKLSNAGQICVAPDYVLVPAHREADFVAAVEEAMVEMYPGEASANKDYQRIVATHHAERISKLVDDAIARGAKCVMGGEVDAQGCYVAPTVLTDIDPNAEILEEEIFGPVLPIIPYTSFDEVVRFVNDRPTPLALYVFSKRKRFVESVLSQIQSGGASINNCVIHVSSNHLPFGGLGNSGIGSGHGEYGFTEFTHLRGSTNSVLMAPEPCSCRRTPRGKPNWSTGSCAGCNCEFRFFFAGMLKRLLHLIALLLLTATAPLHLAAQSFIEHLDPPFWWVDMPVDTVQIMVHGDRVAQLAPVVDYPGVSIAAWCTATGRITRSSTCTSAGYPARHPRHPMAGCHHPQRQNRWSDGV